MVKGYFLKYQPRMDLHKDIVEVLGEFDPLQCTENTAVMSIPEDKGGIKRNEFWTDQFYVSTVTTSSENHLGAVYRVNSVIEKANPKLLSVFQYTPHTVLIVRPRFNEHEENTIYKNILEELTRIATYFMKIFGGDEEHVISLLHDYIDLCISTPDTRE